METEPTLEAGDIQGHVLVGFGRAYELLLGLKLNPDRLAGARTALREIVPDVTPAHVAAAAKSARRMAKRMGVAEPATDRLSVAFALSSNGLRLLGGDPDLIADPLFAAGLASDARSLGDEVDDAGLPTGWSFGATEPTTPDVLLVIAAARKSTVEAKADEVVAALAGAAVVVYRECGRRINREAEHFGFVDGISQPGVRGVFEDSQPVTPRYFPPDNPMSVGWARPGQRLTWPGQFVFGYAGLNPDDAYYPGSVVAPGQPRLKNGSLLVFRRLKQRVGLFWDSMRDLASQLSAATGSAWVAEHAAALCVGRWRDGTPITQSPAGEDAGISRDFFRTNGFLYVSALPPATLVQDGENKIFPGALSDRNGLACPYFGHIRKVNPRDQAHDFGGPGSTLSSQMLRRGIPFGPDWTGQEDGKERGLLFMSYQTSIQRGFHRLMNEWVKDPIRPLGGGIDPLIGPPPPEGRKLSFTWEGKPLSVMLPHRFVEATGGGYFFTPGLRELDRLLDPPIA